MCGYHKKGWNTKQKRQWHSICALSHRCEIYTKPKEKRKKDYVTSLSTKNRTKLSQPPWIPETENNFVYSKSLNILLLGMLDTTTYFIKASRNRHIMTLVSEQITQWVCIIEWATVITWNCVSFLLPAHEKGLKITKLNPRRCLRQNHLTLSWWRGSHLHSPLTSKAPLWDSFLCNCQSALKDSPDLKSGHSWGRRSSNFHKPDVWLESFNTLKVRKDKHTEN